MTPRRYNDLVRRLDSNYLLLYVPRGDHDHAVSAKLRTLMQCRLVADAQCLSLPRRSDEPLLRSYADSNVDLMDADAPPR